MVLVEMKGELQLSRNNSKYPRVYDSLVAFLLEVSGFVSCLKKPTLPVSGNSFHGSQLKFK